MKRLASWALVLLAAVLAIASASSTAWAAPPHLAGGPSRPIGPSQGGALRANVRGGGPVELSFERGDLRGDFELTNVGTGDVEVTRLGTAGSTDDPRMPGGVEVAFEGGGGTARLAPGASRKVVVRWKRDRASHLRELYGHVVVASNVAGPELAVGVHAELAGPVPFVAEHLLSWLVLVPLAAAAALAAMRLVGSRRPGSARSVALAAMAAELVLAAYLYATFDRTVGRIDGNDGFQWIERAVVSRSLGVEYFVGIDGISVPLVLATALLAFVGVVASLSLAKRVETYFAAYCLFVGAAMGAFVALDLVLFFVGFALALVAIALLVGRSGNPPVTMKLALSALVSAALLLAAILALHAHADPSRLADGTLVPHGFAIPELARVDFVAQGSTFAGVRLVEALFVASFVAFAIPMAVVPLHSWLADVLAEAPTAVGVLVAGVVLALGGYGILRIDFAILPEASAWGAPAVAALGVANIVYGALRAMGESDLKRLVAYASMGHVGFALLAMASMTPTGLEGAVAELANHAMIAALLLLLVGALCDRAGTRAIERFGGLAKEMPLQASLLGFALFASLGLPGLSGFVGQILALFGAFPVHRALTLAAAAGAVLTAAWHLSVIERLSFGPFPAEWRSNPRLEPHGGRFPPLGRRELAALLPLAALVLLLGLAPKPLLSLVDRGAMDLAATLSPPGPMQVALVDWARGALAALSL